MLRNADLANFNFSHLTYVPLKQQSGASPAESGGLSKTGVSFSHPKISGKVPGVLIIPGILLVKTSRRGGIHTRSICDHGLLGAPSRIWGRNPGESEQKCQCPDTMPILGCETNGTTDSFYDPLTPEQTQRLHLQLNIS